MLGLLSGSGGVEGDRAWLEGVTPESSHFDFVREYLETRGTSAKLTDTSISWTIDMRHTPITQEMLLPDKRLAPFLLGLPKNKSIALLDGLAASGCSTDDTRCLESRVRAENVNVIGTELVDMDGQVYDVELGVSGETSGYLTGAGVAHSA